MEWLVHASAAIAVQESRQRGGMPDLTPLFMWIGIAVVILVIAGVALMFLRRRVLGLTDQTSEVGLMDDLRAMRDRGEISDEEYRSIRNTMVQRARESINEGSEGPGETRGV